MGFSVGIISFAFAAVGAFIVYANYWVRCLGAWYKKVEPPKDRVAVGAIAFAIMFFLIGSVLQNEYEKVGGCTESGRSALDCTLNQK